MDLIIFILSDIHRIFFFIIISRGLYITTKEHNIDLDVASVNINLLGFILFYYLIVKFYMFYKVFFIFNYFWSFGFLVLYCLVIYCLVFYYLAFDCLATFDLYCDWSRQSHEYLLPIRNLV